MNTIAEIKNLRKSYSEHIAVKDISFSLQAGEILSLLGPNGAGKTTTIKMLLGLLAPTRGRVTIFGGNPLKAKTRKRIGCTPQDTDFPEQAKVKEILQFIASHYESPLPIQTAAKRFLIATLLNRKTSQLSGGQKRCLALACAFVGNCEIVVLDEPTVGLDIQVRKGMWQEFENHRNKGGCLLLTTHYLEEAEYVSDRIIMVNKGRIVKEGNPDQIKQSLGKNIVMFRSSASIRIPENIKWKQNKDFYTVYTANSDIFVKECLVDVDFKDLEIRPMRLEEAFLDIIGAEST